MAQRVVNGDTAVAAALIPRGALCSYKPGECLIDQHAADDSVYFILAGETQIELGGNVVARRVPGETVGEMSAIDASAARSATVRAASETVAFRVSCADFIATAQAYPPMWRALAVVLGHRLRQRSRFHRPANAKPELFIGSSVEGLPIAKQIQVGLTHAKCSVRLWTSGIFGPGGVTVDDLLKAVEESDFAAFIFGPDDKISSRGADYEGPRDNVVFELGLFMSRLGRGRTYIVKERKSEIKIPSDLLGITPITYVMNPGDRIESAAGPICTALEAQFEKLGVIRLT